MTNNWNPKMKLDIADILAIVFITVFVILVLPVFMTIITNLGIPFEEW